MRLICAFACLLVGAGSWAQPLRLLSEVTVRDETVRLSDLIPRNAPLTLQVEAQKISLGRAPQPGGFRVLQPEIISGLVSLLAEFEIPQQIVLRRAGWPLGPETVKKVLSRAEQLDAVDLGKARVELPADFVARTPNPQLELVRIHADPGRPLLLVDMRCHKRSACGEFLVKIFLSAPLPDVGKKFSYFRRAGGSGPALHGPAGHSPTLVEAQRPALLVVEEDGLRITENVVPSRRARLGEIVRVQDYTARRWRLAEVIGKDLLRPAPGRLER